MSIQLFFDKWLARFEQSHLEWLLSFTILVTLTWIVLAVFIYWRRSATNLTPVDLPSANPKATPDFLSIDKRKRKEAIQRGDQYAAEREIAENGSNNGTFRKLTMARKITGWIALVLAVSTLAIIAMGTIWPESYFGNWLNR